MNEGALKLERIQTKGLDLSWEPGFYCLTFSNLGFEGRCIPTEIDVRAVGEDEGVSLVKWVTA